MEETILQKSLSSFSKNFANKIFLRKKITGEAAEKRKEKKLYYAALVKESQEKQKELSEKYRDRAKERREKEKDVENELDQTELTQTGYRSVAPGFSMFVLKKNLK